MGAEVDQEDIPDETAVGVSPGQAVPRPKRTAALTSSRASPGNGASSPSPLSKAVDRPSKRRRLVAFGGAAGIEGAFGLDAAGAVLFSGPAAGGHHVAAPAGR